MFKSLKCNEFFSRASIARNSYVSWSEARLSFFKTGKLYIRVQLRVEYKPAITVCNSIFSREYRLNASRTARMYEYAVASSRKLVSVKRDIGHASSSLNVVWKIVPGILNIYVCNINPKIIIIIAKQSIRVHHILRKLTLWTNVSTFLENYKIIIIKMWSLNNMIFT